MQDFLFPYIPKGMRYEVAVATRVAQTFTYSYHDTLLAGTRVRVPFGNQHLRGVVLAKVPTEDTPYTVKDISELDESEPYYSATLLKIARFLSDYYLCPLGWVLAQMSPNYRPPHIRQKKPQKTKDDSPIEQVTTDKLVELTSGQQQILQEINQFKDNKPILFYGVTDAGKTEIYLRLIAELLEGDGQALVMVPEISLTAQTAGVFQRRFPNQVAIVHSGLTPGKRWQSYQTIRTRQCSLLIGPRSSIFAPFTNLQLIIVDEEHDNSYKQDSHLCYHGRDIAVMRGSLDQAKVVLGSATPSLESWHNSIIGKYNRVELHQRVHAQDNKAIHVLKRDKVASKSIDLAQVKDRVGSERLAPAITSRIAKTLNDNKQVIVIINRRGFSHFLINVRNNEVLGCPSCSVSLTLHNNFTTLKCHYCNHRVSLAEIVARQEGNWEVCGYGSERIEKVVQKHFPEARIARLDSDIATKAGYLNETLGKFRDHQLDILVGTQMLAKGHDFPRVALLVLLQADQMLSLPDFRAAERTFQLLVQAMGRAGRSDNSSEVVIEVIRDDNPLVATAIAQDYPTFVKQELEFRRQFNYPPFSRMACVEMSSQNTNHLQTSAEKIGQQLAISRDLRILGPADPPIIKINKRYRKVIYFTADNVRELHNLLVGWLAKLPAMISRDVRLKIDVDPQSTL